MQRRRRAGGLSSMQFWTTGWLFADLFVALTMGFLVANTVVQNPPPMPTPTPTPIPPTFTPAPIASLEPQPDVFCITVNAQALVNDDPATVQAAEAEVRARTELNGRKAGLAQTFGGAPLSDPQSGNKIAQHFNSDVLMDLGNQGFVFQGTAYDDFHNIGINPSEVEVHVYLFKQSDVTASLPPQSPCT